ncbi:MAG TPA: hypothetical protein PKU91_10550, partial [Phycisphaerales bacterium]|nr:hypothetical protein [Phycisphaerales bacterium]
MAKHSIDDILNELGLAEADQRKKPRHAPRQDPGGEQPHPGPPQSERTFSPLPPTPTNQRLFRDPPSARAAEPREDVG